MNKLLIFGNYGANNFGDELVLKGILSILKSLGYSEADFTVLSVDPDETRSLFNVNSDFVFPTGLRSFFKFSLFKTLRHYQQCDAVVFGGGTLFTGENPRTFWISGLQILPALFLRKKVICFGQGVGPLPTRFGRWIIRQIFSRMNLILVRDKASKQHLESAGVKTPIHTVPDPALFLTETNSEKAPDSTPKNEVLICLREWPKKPLYFSKTLAIFLDWISTTYSLTPHFLAFGPRDGDEILAERIASLMTTQTPQITPVTMTNYLDLFSRGAFAINSRYHANVLSFTHGTPSLGIPYETKIKNLYLLYNQEEFLVESFDLETLKATFNSLIQNQKTIASQLMDRSKELKSEADEEYGKLLS